MIAPNNTETKLQLFGDTHEKTSGDGYKRTLRYKSWRKNVGEQMFFAGMEDEAQAFWSCAENPKQKISSHAPAVNSSAETAYVCTQGQGHDALLFFSTCDNRGCPDCARRQTARFAHRYVPLTLELAARKDRYRLRHIVLTTPYDLKEMSVEEGRQRIRDCRNSITGVWKMLETKKRKTLGSLESFEFGANGHKLHFHILHYGSYLPQVDIVNAWRKLTGGECEVVFVRAIGLPEDSEEKIKHDVIETLKYSTKFWSTDKVTGEIKYIDPSLMPKLMLILKGTRRVRSSGVFYNIPEPENEPLCCADCGHEMSRVRIKEWHLWLSKGAVYEDIKAMDRASRLKYTLANKSPPKTVPDDKPTLPETAQLPGFDKLSTKDKAFYEYK